MPVRLSGSTSGYTELAAPAVAGNNSIALPTANGSAYQIVRNGATAGSLEFADKLVSGTVQSSTSGTAIDFTSIPSWVKRITVMFNGVSTNGSSSYNIRLGTSGGVESTGYDSATSIGDNVASYTANSTTGFIPGPSVFSAATSLMHGGLTITNISGNIWIAFGNFSIVGSNSSASCAGTKTLSGTLDRVRITTVNGTDTFDAGTVNIMYE